MKWVDALETEVKPGHISWASVEIRTPPPCNLADIECLTECCSIEDRHGCGELAFEVEE